MRVNIVPKLFWWLIFFRAFLFSFPNIVSRVLGFYKVLICCLLKVILCLISKGWQGKKMTDETKSSALPGGTGKLV